MSWTLAEIADGCHRAVGVGRIGEYLGEPVFSGYRLGEVEVVGPASLLRAGSREMSFCVRSRESGLALGGCRAGLLLVEEGIEFSGLDVGAVIVCRNARLSFIRVCWNFFPPCPPKLRVGLGCEIHSTAVLGGEGFGFERGEGGRLELFPHYGGVVLGDYVDVGANSCVDRGALTDTIIGHGTKVDNLVHIAHGARIGADSLVIAGAVVCGSAVIGDRCWIGPNAVIRDGVTLGDDVTVGMGSVVTRDVPSGKTVYGVPARSVDDLRATATPREGE